MSNRLAGTGPAGGVPEDAWYDDNAGPIVRLYAMTGGRADTADREFTVSTMVTRAGDRTVGADLPEEKSAILRLCARALSVAEIAAHLSLPLGTVESLLGDLRRAGLVQTPEQPAEGHLSADVMRRLRDGLLAL
jgi:Protein of unknown function (DUF742)